MGESLLHGRVRIWPGKWFTAKVLLGILELLKCLLRAPRRWTWEILSSPTFYGGCSIVWPRLIWDIEDNDILRSGHCDFECGAKHHWSSFEPQGGCCVFVWKFNVLMIYLTDSGAVMRWAKYQKEIRRWLFIKFWWQSPHLVSGKFLNFVRLLGLDKFR